MFKTYNHLSLRHRAALAAALTLLLFFSLASFGLQRAYEDSLNNAAEGELRAYMLTLIGAAPQVLALPLLGEHECIDMPEPLRDDMLPEYLMHEPAQTRRWVEQDLQTGFTHYHIYDDTGLSEHPEMQWRTREIREEAYRIKADDPLSAVCTATHRALRQYGAKRLEVIAQTEMQLKAEQFAIQWDLRVLEDDVEIFARRSEEAVLRAWL